jgi:hypothetical protein
MKYKAFIVSLFFGFALLVLGSWLWRIVEKRGNHGEVVTVSAASIYDIRPAAGNLDTKSHEAVHDGELRLNGWALHEAGITSATLVINEERRVPVSYGTPRGDVKLAFPNASGAGNAGFHLTLPIGWRGTGGHQFELELSLLNGKVARLGPWFLELPPARAWSVPIGLSSTTPFHLVIATSNLKRGGAQGINERFGAYASSTMRIGISVPILYLRTTRGRAGDWVFDPEFDTSKKCSEGRERALVEDNLESVIAYAVREQMPVLLTLNGGVWADAACDSPQWDINDALEQERENCQWNAQNEVMPDNYFASLPGTHGGPELGRVLSYNIFNTKAREYKRRNLLAAAARVATFAREHPSLFIGVNLDSDTYFNPFFEGKQWYDYNPNTVKQFHLWLQGRGPYEDGFRSATVPNLSAHRRAQPLNLASISKLMGKPVTSWDEVDPPRQYFVSPTPYWDDPWTTLWEQFKRHVIDIHYDELSQWTHEAGVAKEKIFSSQGFMPPREPINPAPIYLNSPGKNYDTGGMSIEGAVPSHGGLGAVIYGDAARGAIRTENGRPLFSIFNELSPHWAAVEFHPGDLREPDQVPNFVASYSALRAMLRGGAQFVSHMAWNGGSGKLRNEKGFVALTVIRDSPLETAMKHVLNVHRDLPRRSLAWTFGTLGNRDDEGWEVKAGSGHSDYGQFLVRTDSRGSATLLHRLGEGVSLSKFSHGVIQLSIEASASRKAQTEASATLMADTKPLVTVESDGSLSEAVATLSSAQTVNTLSVQIRAAPHTMVNVHRIALIAR